MTKLSNCSIVNFNSNWIKGGQEGLPKKKKKTILRTNRKDSGKYTYNLCKYVSIWRTKFMFFQGCTYCVDKCQILSWMYIIGGSNSYTFGDKADNFFH